MNCFVQWRLDFLNIDISTQTVSHRSFLIFENLNRKYSYFETEILKKNIIHKFQKFPIKSFSSDSSITEYFILGFLQGII